MTAMSRQKKNADGDKGRGTRHDHETKKVTELHRENKITRAHSDEQCRQGDKGTNSKKTWGSTTISWSV